MNHRGIDKITARWLACYPLYLDTETTGLGGLDQIVQIAITGDDGRVYLDTLVQPTIPIPLDATRIHGIKPADVAGAPTWKDIWQRVHNLINTRCVIIYNASYDVRMMQQSCAAHGIGVDWMSADQFNCAMLAYAEYYGEWNEFRGGWKWQKLELACQQQGIDTSDITAHRAAGDCELTRRLVHRMAEPVLDVGRRRAVSISGRRSSTAFRPRSRPSSSVKH